MSPDLHPGDALSALLDGRLSGSEAAEVQAHVLTCVDCAAELDAVREARASVRTLPAVEPPAGFLDGVLLAVGADDLSPAPSRGLAAVLPLRRRAALANAAAAVVAGLFLVVTTSGGEPAVAVSPEVGGAVEEHASTVSAMSAGLGGAAPGMRPSEVRRPYLAPKRLGDYELIRARHSPEGLHLLYRKAGHGLSVFEQEGDLDLDRLPSPGERLEIDGYDAWRWTGAQGRGRVVVVERDGVVVTLVGDESADAVLAAARALPDGGRSEPFGTRFRRACGDALDALSPTG